MSATQRAGRLALDDADLEQLSAWLDGELDPRQERAMLERLKADPALREQFEWFNLAGDALRSHETAACDRPLLVGRVCEALRDEPVRLGPGALRRHLATGLTVAAAAGMLAVVALPQLRGGDAAAPGPVAAVPMAPAPAGGIAVPVTRAAPVAILAGAVQPGAPKVVGTGSPTLDAYFRAHRELAATGVMPSAAAYIRMSAEQDR